MNAVTSGLVIMLVIASGVAGYALRMIVEIPQQKKHAELLDDYEKLRQYAEKMAYLLDLADPFWMGDE